MPDGTWGSRAEGAGGGVLGRAGRPGPGERLRRGAAGQKRCGARPRRDRRL